MTYFTDKEIETLSTTQLDFVDTCKLSWQLIKKTHQASGLLLIRRDFSLSS